MLLTSSRLVCRKPQLGDALSLFAIYGDPRTNEFNPAGPLADIDEAQELLKRWLGHWDTHGYGWWAISKKDAPKQIIGFGGIAIHAYLAESRVNLGYRFTVEAWGNGYATELGLTALNHAFNRLHMNQVFGLVRPDHVASIRVLRKIGMQPYSTLDDVPGEASSLVFRAHRSASVTP